MIARVIEARKYVLSLFVTAVALSAWLSSSLTFDPNNRVFFGPGHDHYRALTDLEATFGSNTNLFFLIHSRDDLFRSEDLEPSLRWLSNQAWRIENVVSVDSVASYPHIVSTQDEIEVFDILDFICAEGDRCSESRAGALDKPYLKNRFVAGNASAFSVVAKVDLASASPGVVQSVAQQARDLRDEFKQKYPSLSIYLTGGVPMMQAFFEAAQSDSAVLLPSVVAVLSIGLYLFLGGFVPALLMLVLGLSTVAITFGFAGAWGLVINTATATVPLIVFTLVVAASMHVFLHIVREERLESREAVVRATITAVNANWRPVLLTASTTAVGLLSMLFVSAPPLRELGALSAIGVIVGAALTLSVVPCMFAFLPRLKTSNYLSFVQERMNRYAAWIERAQPRWIVWSFSVLLLIALIGTSKISFDEDFVRYFSKSTDFRRDTERITELMAGPYHIDVVFDSGSPAGVFERRSIQHIDEIVSFLREREDVENVISLLDVLREVAPAFSSSPNISELASDELAQLFLTYELSLDMGQSTKDLVDLDQRRARMSVLLGDVSMGNIRGLVQSLEGFLADRGLSNKVVVTGEGVPTAFLSSESIREMAVGIVVSVFASVLLVGAYFGSLKACATIFAATGLPILAGFGAWGWIESEIGMAATLVVATTIGVVIDDTIHLTYRYIDGLRNLDLTPWGATAYSIHKAGTAIFITSVVLVAGLLVLIVSDFRMNSTFGVCASLVVALALGYNLVLAPRLLSRLR